VKNLVAWSSPSIFLSLHRLKLYFFFFHAGKTEFKFVCIISPFCFFDFDYRLKIQTHTKLFYFKCIFLVKRRSCNLVWVDPTLTLSEIVVQTKTKSVLKHMSKQIK
jgi:hypothetical protein